MSLGKRLAELRQLKAKVQTAVARELSQLAGAPISRSALSLWELDIHEPDAEMLRLLATYYGVTVDYLLGRTSETIPHETGAFYDSDDLASRWPNLSPDRRRKAADMERDAKAQGIEMHLGRGLTNEELDSLLRDVAIFAAFAAGQKTASEKTKE